MFVIISDEPEQVIADWKQRDPGMFRWKSREGVSHSKGPGPVLTWHNATDVPSEGDPLIDPVRGAAACDVSRAPPHRVARLRTHQRVVVLVDARATGKVTLAQLTDYIAMVSLAQLDLTVDLGVSTAS